MSHFKGGTLNILKLCSNISNLPDEEEQAETSVFPLIVSFLFPAV